MGGRGFVRGGEGEGNVVGGDVVRARARLEGEWEVSQQGRALD